MTPMNRSEFIKRMGAAALIPFVPNVVDNRPVVDSGHVVSNTTSMIDSTITLVTNDDPINYRTVVHAYDMTLETVMDEYTPYDNDFLRAVAPFQRTMTLSNLPDNYDKYELSVWKTNEWVNADWTDGFERLTLTQPIKVFSRSYTLGFPTEVVINLTGRNV